MRVTEIKKVALVCVLLAITSSCHMVGVLSGDEKAGTVDNLWSDVPAFAGAGKADLAIPLGARLLIRAAMQGRVNFIAFTVNKNTQEVENFYTAERMKSDGWTANEDGCLGDSEEGENQGAVCFFSKKSIDKEEGLAIIIAQDQKSKQTEIFYARADLTDETAKSKQPK